MVSEIYDIIDCYFYNSLTDSSALSNFSLGSAAHVSFSDDGMYSYATASGNHDSRNHIILNHELPTDFEVDFTYMGGDSYSVNAWCNSGYIQTSNTQHTRAWFYTGYNNISGTPPSYSDIAEIISVGDNFKFLKENDELSIYHNNTLVTTGTVPDTVMRKFAILNCCGGSRNTRIKDLKIKTL